MSVINNVLKDLDSRESHFTPIEISTGDAAPDTRRDPKPMLLAAVLLLILAAGAWFYLQPQSPWNPIALLSQDSGGTPAAAARTASVNQMPTATEAPASIESSSPAQTEAAPAAGLRGDDADSAITAVNQIVGLQIRESEREMRMEFVLREKVVAYLRERGENSFGYHLRDIESRIAAPLISDNPWIRTLAIEAGESGVEIRFETAPDILVETRQALVDGEPVWAINLRQAIPSAAVAQVVEQAAVAEDTAIEARSGDTDSAKSAAESPPVEPLASTAAAEVRLEIKTTNPGAKNANQLEYASRLMSSGRYTDAESLLRELLGSAEDFQARRLLLAFYQGRKLNERFARLTRESVAKYPQDATFRTEYARSLLQDAKYPAVIELLTGQASLDAKQQALLAASYQRLDQHGNAIRHYRLALRQDSGNAKNWIGLGVSQEHSAALGDALDSYERAGKIGQLSERLRAFVEQRSQTLRRVLN